MRRILGIDPGSRVTGFGVVELKVGEKPTCLGHGCVRLSDAAVPMRLAKLFTEMQEIARTYVPTEVAIERVFVHKNVQSALKLGQAQGVAFAALADLPIYTYAPRAIKLAVVGRGNAEKAQVQHMVQVLLMLTDRPALDAADALGVALCHLHSAQGNLGYGKQALLRKGHSTRRTDQWKSYDRTTAR